MSGTYLQQHFHKRKPMTFDALLKGSVFALAAVAFRWTRYGARL